MTFSAANVAGTLNVMFSVSAFTQCAVFPKRCVEPAVEPATLREH